MNTLLLATTSDVNVTVTGALNFINNSAGPLNFQSGSVVSVQDIDFQNNSDQDIQFANNSDDDLQFDVTVPIPTNNIQFTVQQTVNEMQSGTWDLTLDSSGNIALASEPYALAQDAATGCRTFLGECYYNTALGVPFFQQILGKNPPLNLVRQQFISQCLLVPDVVQAQVYFDSLTNRGLTGQIQVTNTAGTLTATPL